MPFDPTTHHGQVVDIKVVVQALGCNDRTCKLLHIGLPLAQEEGLARLQRRQQLSAERRRRLAEGQDPAEVLVRKNSCGVSSRP